MTRIALINADGCAASEIADRSMQLRAEAAALEAQESDPVACTKAIALECSGRALAFEVCAANIWGERGVPLYRHPDPRIAELGGLLREAFACLHDPAGFVEAMAQDEVEFSAFVARIERRTEDLLTRIRAALKGDE